MTALLALLGLVVLIVVWAVAIYNRLVRLRNLAAEGESGIDVQLKRRSDLVPNLVETVKAYAGHEKELFTRVTTLRGEALSAREPAEKARAEGALGAALRGLLAVAENYPELKASANFGQLQGQLADIESELQLARRYYNATVRDYNTRLASFPDLFLARGMGFAPREFFELEDPGERAAPKVSFS
jgi:LemA protein